MKRNRLLSLAAIFALSFIFVFSTFIVVRAEDICCDNPIGGDGGGNGPGNTGHGDAVNLTNGNTILEFSDFKIPGRGLPVGISRTYNNQKIIELDGFESIKGGGRVVDGEWSGEGGRALVNNEVFSDFTLNVKMKTISSANQPNEDPPLNYWVGQLIFHYKDLGNLYSVYITTDNKVELYKIKAGVKSWPVSNSSNYNAYQWNTWQIQMIGAEIKVWINNNLEIDYTDPDPLTEGYCGLESTHFNNSHYDDLSVTGTTELTQNFNQVRGFTPPTTGTWGVYNGTYMVNSGRSLSETDWSNFTFDGKMQTKAIPFQNFEANNGTPGSYFWNVWDSQPALSTTQVFRGGQSLVTQGHTVGINPSSSGTVDLSGARSFLVWVYDTQGNNSVELRLRDSSSNSQTVWSTMSSVQNTWTLISWPLSSFNQVDLAHTQNAELYEWNQGTYYFDEIGYSYTYNPWDVAWVDFRYTDSNNYYYFMIRTDGVMELSKWQNGTQTTIVQKPSGLSPFDQHDVRIEAKTSDEINIYVDNNLEITYTDPNPLTSGKVGLDAYWSQAYFDDVNMLSVIDITNDFNNPDGLLQQWGSWSIDNCQYEGVDAKALSNQSFSELSFDADVRTVTQGAQDWQVAWLLFKYLDDNNYYYTLLKPNGTVELSKWQNGTAYYNIATAQTSLSPFDQHHFKVVTSGANIKIYIDTQLIIDYTDSNPLIRGKIGFQCIQSKARFDNLLAQEEYSYSQNFNSYSTSGIFGDGWSFNYDMKVVEFLTGNVSFYRDDGGIDRYVKQPDGTLKNPASVYATITKTQNGYTRHENDGTEEHFDSNGKLTAIVDRNSNTISFTYSGSILTQITDTVGRAITLTYGSNGKVSQITDPASHAWTYAYDSNNQLISVTNPLSQTKTYTYDPVTHNMIQRTDRKGNSYQTQYYYNNQVATQTDPLGNVTTYHYYWDTTYVTNDRGEKYIYKFDPNHYLQSVTNPLDVQWSAISWPLSKFTGVNLAQVQNIELYEYHSANQEGGYNFDDIGYIQNNQAYNFQNFEPGNGTPGNYFFDVWTSYPQFSTTELRSGARALYTQGHTVGINPMASSVDLSQAQSFVVWVKDYRGPNSIELRIRDVSGNSVSVWSDMTSNQKETSVWDDNANLLKKTDRNGNSTTYSYDSKGSILTRTDAQGNTMTLTYEPNFNLVTSAEDAQSNLTTYEYDGHGNRTEITDALDNTITYTYNQYGQPLTATDARSNTTTYQYDAYGSLIKVTDALGNQTQFTYDILGRAASIIDPQNNTTTFQYDAIGRLTSKTDAQSHTTQYSYDANDNVISVIDAKGNTTTNTYDAVNNLTSTTDALSHTTQYTYDAVNYMPVVKSNLLSVTDANNHTTTYQYDAADRLIKATFPGSSYEMYAYDPVGNMTQKVTRKGDAIDFTYDSLNRPIRKTYSDTTYVAYTYDTLSRLITAVDSSGTITHAYDVLGRLTSVTYPNSMVVSYQYDAAGNRTRLTYPDSTYLTYTFNTLNRLTQIQDQNQTTISAFTYDTLSRRTNLTLENGVTADYTYDTLSRLLSLVNQKYPTTLSSFAYTYDQVGNRTSMTTQAGTYNYNYDNIYQLTQVVKPGPIQKNYNLDALGNRTTVVESTTQTYTANNLNQYTAIDSFNLTYDLNGNMIQKTDGSITNTYTYDYENRLKTVTQGANGAAFTYDAFGRRISKEVNSTLQAKYLYDQDNIILDLDSNNNIIAKYIYGPATDEPLVMIKGSNVYYYSRDALGSTANLTDSTGTVVESYTYDEYGNVSAPSQVGNRYLYTGREYDPETGLYSYRARYYDPIIGRFLQTDPIGYAGGINLYTYVGNNPITGTDPKGESWVGVAIGVLIVYIIVEIYRASHPDENNSNEHDHPEGENGDGYDPNAPAWPPGQGGESCGD